MSTLRGRPGRQVPALAGDPLDDDDLHLALYICYELHYRGWAGVDAVWEWDPSLLRLRADLERRFGHALLDAVEVVKPAGRGAAVSALRALVDGTEGPSVSAYMEREGDLAQMREMAVHRSAYQLKEADPHTWAIPRLPPGRAKSALVRLQHDEYGNGRVEHSHAELFADTMTALGLDPTYGAYLDVLPGVTLATVNLLSMLGLHRGLVGACLGHLAVFEMTSVVPMRRYASAMRRVTGGEAGAAFYDVHVIADAEHERVAIDELIPGLLDEDPALAHSVLFGAAALVHVEGRLADHLLRSWGASRSSLLAAPSGFGAGAGGYGQISEAEERRRPWTPRTASA